MTGYLHPHYPQSLAEFGRPRLLQHSGGWLLERSIPRSAERDAMACYPLFICRDWQALRQDIAELVDDLVSVCVVTDPLGNYQVDQLHACFPDLCRPFKEHYVADLTQDPADFVSTHHRLAVKRARRKVTVEQITEPRRWLEEWTALYHNLIRRHHIRGMLAFSRSVFEQQLQVPGLISFRACVQGTTVGMVQWYRQDDHAYLHLAAYSDAGYAAEASYAVFWASYEHLRQTGVRLVNLGAGAGVSSNGADGLSQFKRGWSNGSRTAYLCGKICNQQRYEMLVAKHGVCPTSYFPAYRAGEFA